MILLEDGIYQMSINTTDTTKSYFTLKKNYHYYDQETKDYYANNVETRNIDNIGIEDTCGVTVTRRKFKKVDTSAINETKENWNEIQFPSSGKPLSLEYRLYTTNTMISQLFQKLSGYLFTKKLIEYAYSEITTICKKMNLPKNMINDYYTIVKNRLLSSNPELGKFGGENIINEVCNSYIKNNL